MPNVIAPISTYKGFQIIAGNTKQAVAPTVKSLTIPMAASPFILHLHILLKTTPVSQTGMILHKLKFFKRLYTIRVA